MSLVRLSHSPMTSFLDDFFSPEWSSRRSTSTSIPAVNVQEREKDFLLSFAIPGKNKKDFEIDVENGVLAVSATSSESESTREDHFTRKEFNYQSFKRSFTLPDSINTAKIKANYTDGILTVSLPKKEEALPQPTKKIAIE